MKTQVLASTIVYTISKAKKTSHFSEKALKNNFVPGAGSYAESEKHNTILKNIEKKHSLMSKTSISRFSETIGKSKAWIPGPGAYELGPKLRIDNK